MTASGSTAAIDRVFRAYNQYCTQWNEDSLFGLLNALHSLDDRLKDAHGRVFFAIKEYVALKALRNYFHHQGEVTNVLRVKPLTGLAVSADLMHACMVKQEDCIAAIKGVKEKYRQATLEAVAETFKVWGKFVDINPCVFNCVVKVFETLQRLGESGDSEEFAEFATQYEWETREGHSHYVSGQVLLRPGDAEHYASAMERLYGA